MSHHRHNSEIATLSNMVSFRTLAKPLIEIITKEITSITFGIKAKCNFEVNDNSIPASQVLKRLNEINICNYFNYTLSLTVNIL